MRASERRVVACRLLRGRGWSDVELTTTCYAPMDKITGIRVTSGATAVLQTDAPPGTSW